MMWDRKSDLLKTWLSGVLEQNSVDLIIEVLVGTDMQTYSERIRALTTIGLSGYEAHTILLVIKTMEFATAGKAAEDFDPCAVA